jgi:hypothetical protein
MPDNQKKIMPIDYTSRDYDSIKDDLLQIAERLYPDSFQDFSEGSFASLMIDAVSYVGDQLSFYMDYNVNESFLDTAYQFDNVLRHGRILGYKYTGRPSTYGDAALFLLVPASQTGIGPDTSYIPILKKGTQFSTSSGLNFTLIDNIDFADPKNPVAVGRVNNTTGAPTHYAIKAFGTVVSGIFTTELIKVGNFQKFRSVALSTANVSEVISVHDKSGNEYFEVDYLAQDMVYKQISNQNYKKDNVPSIIKPYLVSRKFVVERNSSSTVLQFGSGKVGDSGVVANPQSVAMDVFGKDYTTSITFDPTRLSENQSLGVVPENTTLTVTLRTTNPGNSNTAVGQLNSVGAAAFEYADRTALSPNTLDEIASSLEVNNETPIVGDVSTPGSGEVKKRIFDTFPTQNRAVTQADYENVTYRMPAKFGSVKRVSAQRDPSSQKRNLNLYVISEDSFGKLTKTNNAIKNNLKIWLNQYRMINDTIDILDPFILNFGIEFAIKTISGADKYTTIDKCINKLGAGFTGGYFIGESFSISDIYAQLKTVDGVLDVIKVKVFNKTGVGYASSTININSNLSPDGERIIIPKNAIVEVKFPATDIIGKSK